MENDKRLLAIDKQLKSISKNPGVYVIYNKKNEIIYVGKAKNLLNRLRSHFAPSNDFSKSRVIREKGVRIEVHEVSSEKEAFLLEYNMIQEHQPVLNEKWKDGKSYPYLEVTTGEQFPRFQLSRNRDNKSSIYIGPFSDVGAVKRSLRYALTLFPVADCKKEIHLGDADTWAHTCIRRRTRQCFRPCEIEIDAVEYRVGVDRVIQFIEGNAPEMAVDLNSLMYQHAEKQEYEKAAKYRDILKSVNRTIERQNVMIEGVADTYVVAEAKTKRELCVAIQKIERGRIVRQDARAIDIKELEEHTWADFILTFLVNLLKLSENSTSQGIKKLILKTTESDELIPQLQSFGIDIISPTSAIENQLIEMTTNHAKKYLQRRSLLKKQKGLPSSRVSDLQQLLQMEYPPFIIDAFDISTLFGTNTVASCVRFQNGKPLKKGYRRFKIKTVVGQDDFASMEEVVYRRYRDVEGGLDPKGLPVPDLIVIDGGSEQLKRAKISLSNLNLDIFVIGLAKKEEEIYLIDQKYPLRKNKNQPGLLLLRSCRDEAHRFAVKYQKLLRQKGALSSILDTIDGIGPKRKKLLNRNYRTISNIAKESSETLSEKIRINKQLASTIIEVCRKYITEQED